MKAVRLNTIIKFGLIFSILLISILLVFHIKILQNRSLANWKRMTKDYVIVKNFQLNSLFFKNEKQLTDNPLINFNYLTNLLESDVNKKESDLVDYMIVDNDFNVIYHYQAKNFGRINQNYTSEQILYNIKNLTSSIEIQDYTVDYGSGVFHVIISPYITDLAYHKYSIIYFFDFSKSMNKVFPISLVFLLIIIIGLSVYLLTVFILNHLKRYLQQISNFISLHIFNDTGKKGKLQYLPPFDDLERKISYLLSQRKEIEDKYFSLSERYQLLLSQTNDGIVMEDIEGYIFFCNKKFAQIFGYNDESDVIGVRFVDLLDDSEAKRKYEVETKFRDINAKSNYKISFINHKKEKKTCLISASNMYDTNNKISGYYGAVTDVSKLTEMGDNSGSVEDSAPNYFKDTYIPWILFKDDLTVYDFNKAALNMLSLNRGELRDMHLYDIFDNYDFGRILKQFDFNTSFQIDTFEPRLNKWLYITNNVIQKSKGIFFNLVFMDITYFRKEESYHKMLFNDLNGFIFMTNHLNEVIYVSPSFFQITQYPGIWFSNYYKSLVNAFNYNENESIDDFVITCPKGKFIFKVIALSNFMDSTKIYLCLLK